MRGNAQEMMEEATSLCYFWRYIPVWKIDECINHVGGMWITDWNRAHIELHWGARSGLLAHELFHSAYACSPLNKVSPAWVEGFCNAFGYFMAGGDDDPIQGFKSFEHNMMYRIPCYIILAACDYDYDKFKSLWWRLNCDADRLEQDGYLDRLFGFKPGWGYTWAEENEF